MSASNSAQQAAINRLFDLVRTGKADSQEFSKLDALIFDRLIETYEDDSLAGSVSKNFDR